MLPGRPFRAENYFWGIGAVPTRRLSRASARRYPVPAEASDEGFLKMAAVPVEQGFELRGERGRVSTLIRDIWHSRELIVMLARKDFFVRYRRASLGLVWAIGLPLIQAIVFGVVLSQFVRFKTAIPYAAFVFTGVLPWTFFSGAVSAAVTSVVEGNALATKIYFPRPVLPIVTVVSGFFGLIPGVVIMGGMALIVGADFGPEILLLIPAIALLMALATGFSLVFSILQVYARDIKHIVSAIMLPWFWGSGIFYPLDKLSKTFRRYLEVNPAVGMIQLLRASVGAATPGWETALWWSLGWTTVLFVLAAFLFRRYDRVCVDLL